MHISDLYNFSELKPFGYVDNCLYGSLQINADGKDLYSFNCENDPIKYCLKENIQSDDNKYVNVINYVLGEADKENVSRAAIDEFCSYVDVLLKWSKASFRLSQCSMFPDDSILYYRVDGDKQYVSNTTVGGANLGGAVVGGAIAGGAGAVVGSMVGTDIKTQIDEKDSRRLLLYYNDSSEICSKEVATEDIDKMLSLFRMWIPEKEYEHILAMGLNFH